MMKKIEHLVPVGSWITTQDIFELAEFKDYANARVIHGLHCTGSAALGDTGGELKTGTQLVAKFFNSKLGNAATAAVADFRAHYQKIGASGRGVWSLYPTANATTNGVYLCLYLD